MTASIPRTILAAAALSALLTASCGGEDEPAPVESVPAPPQDDAPVPDTGRITLDPHAHRVPKTTANPVAKTQAYVSEKVDLRIRLKTHEVERFAPVRARIEVHNLGKRDVVLISPDEMIANRMHLRVTRQGKTLNLTTARAPTGAPREHVLARGQMFGADVDLEPLLRNTLAYEEGRVRFRAVYRGAADLMPGSASAWNRAGDEELVTREIMLEIVEPKWRRNLRTEPRVVGDVSNALLTWRKGAPNEAEVKERITAHGADGVRALFFLVGGMGSTRRETVERAAQAFAMLRELAPSAVGIARELADVDDPAVRMVSAFVITDTSGASGPAFELVRSIQRGGEDAVWLSIELLHTQRIPAENYMLDGSGRLSVQRAGAEGGRVARQLSPHRLGELKLALLVARPWLWRTTRNRRLAGEGRVTVRMSSGRKTVFEVLLPEGEALDANPAARSFLDTFAKFADSVGTAKRSD